MLHIILLILKILGIILAVILGLILLIVLLVLLVPIRYGGEASFDGKPKFRVKVGWIPGLVAVILSNYTGKIGLVIKVCGFTIKDTLKPPKEKKSKEKKKKSKEEDADLKDEDVYDALERLEEEAEEITTVEAEESKAVEGEETRTAEPEEARTVEPVEAKASGEAPDTEKVPLSQKLTKKYEAVTEKLKNKLNQLSEKLKSLQDKKEKVTEIFFSEQGQKVIFRVKRLVFKLLTHIRPRHIRGHLELGMGDGYKTAKVLSILSVLYPVYTNTFKIEPDFDEKVLAGDIRFRGHITLGYLAILGLRGYLDKGLKKMIRDIKQLKN